MEFSSFPFLSPLLHCRGLSAVYFSKFCLLKVCKEISNLPLPPSPMHSEHPALSAVCPFQFLVYYSGFFCVVFLQGGGHSVQGAMLVYPRGGNTVCHLFAHLLVCISQAGLEPVSGGTGALLFSQCKVAWRDPRW
jgi:hypothetical protein